MSEASSRHDFDKRVIRTKKAIKAALFRIMEEKDISSISISELTREANVNRRTFYTHYHSITDILEEIEGDLVEALGRLVEGIDRKTPRQSAYDLFIGLDSLITVEFSYYFQLVRVDMRSMLMSRLKNVIKGMTDTLLEQLCKRHGANAAVISPFVVGGFFNMYLEWHNHPDGLSIEQAAELAGRLVELCITNAVK
ncbi:MAG: TetR/AcrR family transcriptional regulator [Oscillospiraceae bacterium]|nr:TetR/AcrR family transcriptional regulator [Oscillospiraceae bacterium]